MNKVTQNTQSIRVIDAFSVAYSKSTCGQLCQHARQVIALQQLINNS